MLTYALILLWITNTIGSPIKTASLLYYAPAQSQYVESGLYPFVSSPLGKALQSIQSPNELVFYPNSLPAAQPVVINRQPEPANRFTAPPEGLVNAIYAWFAENNIPIPPENPIKNEAPEPPKKQEKLENLDKPSIASEVDVLTETDRNPLQHYPRKSATPSLKQGQRYYILNGQPQYFSGNYQPLIPQLLTRSAIAQDPAQNVLILQSQSEIQQPKLKKSNSNGQNYVLVQNNPETKPIRYHNPDLKPQQNYVILQEAQQPETQQQHLLFGRLLPQVNEIKSQDILQSQVSQTPIHQTQYVPVEVVPPQIPFQNIQEQQNSNSPHLSFIHIPIDRNVQPPQYIKSLVPIQLKTAKPQEVTQRNSGNPILYLSQPIENQENLDEKKQKQNDAQEQQQQQQQPTEEIPPGVAALEFARYITSQQDDLYSDSVIIDAKSENDNDNKNEEQQEEDSEMGDVVQADTPQEPSLAQAQPGAIALAGPGGVAATAPRGTALVGEKGLAIASPQATAVAGPNSSERGNKNKKSSTS